MKIRVLVPADPTKPNLSLAEQRYDLADNAKGDSCKSIPALIRLGAVPANNEGKLSIRFGANFLIHYLILA